MDVTEEDAMRHGKICLEVTGKTALQIMMEHAEMFGYLSVQARDNQELALMLRNMENKNTRFISDT